MREEKNTKKRTDNGKSKAATADKKAPQKEAKLNDFPIVGLGASAGGLNALKSFFRSVTPGSSMAYIVVVHLTPNQPSMMAELLQKVAPIPVQTAIDDQRVEPDHIYVVPPDKEISIYHGSIQLLNLVEKHHSLPIDRFLKSLALDQGAGAVAVILSGTGTDGTLGIKEIKACDGLVMVQEEKSAEYDGMPRSAINSGVVDIVLPAERMPQKLIQYFKHRRTALKEETAPVPGKKVWLNKIFAILRTKIGHDFSQYKTNTLLRRIGRRMSLNQIVSYDNYVRFLRENPDEVDALFRELLIGVTSFFRDPESFEVLKSKVLPRMIDHLPEDSTLRAWVPGCSTGEEVFSLAIVLREILDTNPKRINLQMFGTDIDSFAIDKARTGLYPASIAVDVSKERLKRFFNAEGDFYRIRKDIRDCTVFSVQDLIKDPPFSRLHLLCCRNLLIYLDSQAQKKLFPLFHYTLHPEGVLMLGSSETIGGFTQLFDILDKKWKIFKPLEVPRELIQQIDFPSGLPTAQTSVADMIDVKPAEANNLKANISHITQKAILDQFAPAAVLVDRKGNILFVQGRTGKYLEAPSGVPNNNILDMAREGLRIELSSALRAARSTNQAQIRRKIRVKTNGDFQMINLHVYPQQKPKELAGRFLIFLEDIENILNKNPETADLGLWEQEPGRIAALENELQNTRESHQTTIEELESSNEELKSTNEELQSSNEELQSTNEELESSKEELQSLNEEMHTVNAELRSKVEELSAAHDDMRNLLNSTEIATIFVDNEGLVKRFTPEATNMVNLIQTDIGRPLQHVVTNLTYHGMSDDLQAVLKHLTPKTIEVQTTSGAWYKLRIVPYRTTDNRIDGAVLTFVDINEQKLARQLTRDVFDMNTDPMAVLDDQGKLIIANATFTQTMNVDERHMQGADVLNIHNALLDKSDLKSKLLNAAITKEDFLIDAGQITGTDLAGKYTIKGRIIKTEDGRPYRILLHFIKESCKEG